MENVPWELGALLAAEREPWTYPSLEPSGEHSPADTLTSGCCPLELWDKTFCCPKPLLPPPCVGFVMAAQGNSGSGLFWITLTLPALLTWFHLWPWISFLTHFSRRPVAGGPWENTFAVTPAAQLADENVGLESRDSDLISGGYSLLLCDLGKAVYHL